MYRISQAIRSNFRDGSIYEQKYSSRYGKEIEDRCEKFICTNIYS